MGGPAAVSFLGPEGVNARIAQIQARLDSLGPKVAPSGFQAALDTHLANRPLDPSSLVGGAISGPIGGGAELRAMADSAATRNGVDPALLRALVHQESGWNPSATSGVGAKGLCQLMDGTARELGVSDPYDPSQSLDGGARYLRKMLDLNGGDPARALASYNAGYGRIKNSSPADWPHETKGYVTSILSHLRAGA